MSLRQSRPARVMLALAIAAMAGLGIIGVRWLDRAEPGFEEEAAPARQGEVVAACAPAPPDPFAPDRRQMVERQLRERDITDERILAAMARVERHRFVPPAQVDVAYADHPVPIGHRQTISQPYVVALMTQLVQPTAKCRALDIGTGSGYQAAVLGELCKEVYSVEIIKPLAEQSKQRLAELEYRNITVRQGDGYRGWPEHAPFDVIIVAAAASHVPQPLIDQLAPGGRLVMPVGDYFQELLLIEKDKEGNVTRRSVAPVAFVPMTGEARKQPEEDP